MKQLRIIQLARCKLVAHPVGAGNSTMPLSSLVKSYPSVFPEVSQSRADQVMSILKLPPGYQGEGECQLIHRQGLQDRKLPH